MRKAVTQNEDSLKNTQMNPVTGGPPPIPVYGVNVILGGAMLSGIILAIFVLCYCCHKTNRKSSPSLSSMIWRDPDFSPEIYTVESAQNRLVEMEDYVEPENDPHSSTPPGPPPAYDTVIMSDNEKRSKNSKSSDSSGLPSYEAALRSLDQSTPVHWTPCT